MANNSCLIAFWYQQPACSKNLEVAKTTCRMDDQGVLQVAAGIKAIPSLPPLP
jgi:hypothetical protein